MNVSIMSAFKIASRTPCSYISEYETTALKMTEKLIYDWSVYRSKLLTKLVEAFLSGSSHYSKYSVCGGL